MQSFRNILRWIFVALALAFTVWTAPEMIHDFHEWRGAIPGNPVAASFWRAAFYADATDVIVVLAVGLFVWLTLRPRRRAAAPSTLV